MSYVFFWLNIHNFHKILKGFSYLINTKKQCCRFYFLLNLIEGINLVFSTLPFSFEQPEPTEDAGITEAVSYLNL